ncbi:MAG: CdvA-like protein [Desulfurococcales archaeon]|nr:CdvA-like protein [Desulfurococcales archaeon]
MLVLIDEVEKHLGSRVRDPYGRTLGILSSIYSDIDGSVSSIEILREDGILLNIPSERISITPDGIIVIPEWKIEAIRVEQHLDRARKRSRALEDLFSSKEIGSQAYEEIKKGLDATLTRLRERSKQVKGLLRKRLGEIEDELLHLDKAINHLKLSYTSGEIGEQRFKASIENLRAARNRYIDEKKDVEKHIEALEKLETDAVIQPKIPTEIQVAQPKIEMPQQNQQKPIEVRIVSS